jgi:hypothetical protein
MVGQSIRLTDFHAGPTHILKGEQANGFWALEVARAGGYQFSLRHQTYSDSRRLSGPADRVGRMELWNNGMMGKSRGRSHDSSIPSFQ